MAINIREKMDERMNLVKKSREILDFAEKENRSLTAEEQTKFNNLEKDIVDLNKKIENEQRQLDVEKNVQINTESANDNPGDNRNSNEKREQEFENALEKYCIFGYRSLSTEEKRALMLDNDNQGGFILSGEKFVNEIIKNIDNQVYVRQISTKHKINNEGSIGAPSLDEDVDDAEWTGEIKTGNETDMKFGKRQMKTNKLSKRIKVSESLLNNSSGSVINLINERFSYKFSITEEKAFLTGDGQDKPLGLFHEDNNGIKTSDNLIVAKITFDSLMDIFYSLKEGHRKHSNWLFNDEIIKAIRKIKDSNGQYIWSPTVVLGEPDKILNRPYISSEYCPGTLDKDGYIGILGDFRFYWILDCKKIIIKRLDELYAEEDCVGFIAKKFTDGAPVLSSAFKRLQLKKN